MKSEILRLQGVSLVNEKELVLDNVYMNVFSGETVGIVGANGQGKNWLIQILSGRRRCNKGEIWINNEKGNIKSIGDAQKQGVFLIHHTPVVMPHLTIAENVQLSVKGKSPLHFVDEKAVIGKTNEILKRLKLSLKAEDKTSSLTFGGRHIVEIVRAINGGAKVLIFDDIDAGYTGYEKERLLSLIRELKSLRVACIIFSYDAKLIGRLAERIYCMKAGRVTNVFFKRDIDVDGIRRIMSNRLTNRKMPGQASLAEPVFRIEKMNGRKFKELHAEIGKGEIAGLFFHAEGGTDEFIKMLLEGKSSGKFYMYDEEICNKAYGELFKKGIMVLPDCYSHYFLMDTMGIWENLTLGCLKKRGRRKVFVNRRLEKYLYDSLKERILGEDGGKENIQKLSVIEKRLLVFYRVYLTAPDIFIVETPVTGLDKEGKERVFEALRQIASKGTGILLVTSDMEEVTNLCDRKIEIPDIV